MFLPPRASWITRLTSFKDLLRRHPDVGHPRRQPGESHVDVFMATVAKYFGS